MARNTDSTKEGNKSRELCPASAFQEGKNLRFHSLGVFKLPQDVSATFIYFWKAPPSPIRKVPSPLWLRSEGPFPLGGIVLL